MSILSTRGPIVIDWSNADVGDALSDAALTYVLLTCPQMPGPWVLRIAAQPARESLARLFARRYQDNSFAERIVVAADLKTLDRHMTPAEIANLHRLAGCERRHDSILPQTEEGRPADPAPSLNPRQTNAHSICVPDPRKGRLMSGVNESVGTVKYINQD